MNNLNMKTKMALAVSLMFVVLIVLLAWGALYFQEQSLKKAISRQQFTLVSSLAASIDDKLGLAHNALITAASQMPPEALLDADLAQGFLDARISLHSVFDNGLFLISSHGGLIAESPFLPDRRGRDMTSFEFFQRTLATGRPYISEPYTSVRAPGHPAIFLSAPIVDDKGKVVAILGGSFDLWGTNFLKDLAATRYGDLEFFSLTARDRTIIVHPDRSKILTRKLPPESNPLYEKALGGFEGSGETVTARGERIIASVRSLQTTGWILTASSNAAEAYAPLEKTRRYFLLATLTITLAVLTVTWLLMKRLTAPLAAFTRHVEALPETFGRNRLIEIDSGDEIGIMAQAFNRMVTTLEMQQATNAARLETLLRLNDMSAATLKEIADFALEEVVRLTRSSIGYLAFVNDDESVLTMYAWSKTAMEQCAVTDKPLEYRVADTGLWGEAVRRRRPVITNDYAAPNPGKKGYPAGHVELRRHMNVPIFDGDRIVLVAGVGNKEEEYDETDVQQLALLMQGLWRIVQRKQAEEALREEKKKFSLAFHTVPSVLVIASLADGRYLEVNEAFERVMGYRRDEVLGRSSLEFNTWNPEERVRVLRLLAQGEKVRNLEIGFRSKSGAEVFALYSAAVIEIGGERCLLSLANDITDRKKAEEELSRSEERYRRLYNETPVMLHSIDHDRRLVSVSNYWLESLGYVRNEVLGRRITDFHTEESRRYAEEVVLLEFFRTGFCKDVPYQLVKKNGEVMDVLLSATSERNDKGEIVCSLAVMIDVTERKRAQEEIEKLNADLRARARELENANRELESFSYSVSHDLRTPLTVISGYCQVIREFCAAQLSEQCFGFIQEIEDGAGRMNELIDTLLSLCGLARRELHRETVDLSEIAHLVAAELTLTDLGRRVAFQIANGISVNGDAKLLRVVLENLLGNAWKYTAHRDEAIIEFGLVDIDGKAACFVRDNGAGFDMAAADKLFMPFQRLHADSQYQGHGIGLATVERIIRRHGGRIWAQGEPEKGATFWFSL